MKTEIYSIIYSPEQIPEYIPYDNSAIRSVEQHSYLFENNVIKGILDNKPFCSNFSQDYLGIFSWKFSLKTGIFRKKLEWYLENNGGYDIYIFCKKLKQPYFEFTERVHPGFKLRMTKLIQKLRDKTGIELEYREPQFTVYSNFFVAKLVLYQEFYSKVLNPSIELLLQDPELIPLMKQKVNYKGLEPSKLKEFTGLDVYWWHTFVLERLFSLYIDWKLKQDKNLKIWQVQ